MPARGNRSRRHQRPFVLGILFCVLLAVAVSRSEKITKTKLSTPRITCPYQERLTAFSPAKSISACTAFRQEACCDRTETNELLLWYYSWKQDYQTFDTAQTCLDQIMKLKCGLSCSPHQSHFLSTSASPSFLYSICSSFCEELYSACGSGAPSSISADFISPKHFCEHFDFEFFRDVSIIVTHEDFRRDFPNCFNGRIGPDASPQNSFVYGRGLNPIHRADIYQLDAEKDILVLDSSGTYSGFIGVQAVDEDGRELRDGGHRFVIQISPNSEIQETRVDKVEVIDHHNGIYGVHYSLTGEGEYLVSVTLSGKHISNSPALLHVEGLDSYASWCPLVSSLTKSDRLARPAELSHCKSYRGKACCDSQTADAVGVWLKEAIHPVFGESTRCSALFESLYCGYRCSPRQGEYVLLNQGKEEGVPKDLKIFLMCPQFCQEFYAECLNQVVMGMQLKSVYTRYQDFCMANTPDSNLQIQVDHSSSCFNGVIAPVSAKDTLVFGSGVSKGLKTPDTDLMIVVQTRDLDGQLVLLGGEAAYLRVDFQGAYIDRTGWIDYRNGTYSMTYRASHAGEYDILLWYRGEKIGKSPYSVVVGAGRLDPLACKVDGAGMSVAVAGQEAEFVVQALDQHGNRMERGEANVLVKFKGGEPVAAEDFDSRNVVVSADRIELLVKEEIGGEYKVRYIASNAGQYVMKVTVNGFQVFGSPFLVTVFPEEITDPKFTELQKSWENEERKEVVGIVTRDRFGNERKRGGEKWSVEVVGPPETGVESVVEDLMNGRYRIHIRAPSEGVYSVFARLERSPDEGGPAELRPVEIMLYPEEGKRKKMAPKGIGRSYKF